MSQRRRKYKPGSVISGTSYKVLRHIGSGAMGAVYEALHCELNKAFVIKVLHHDLVQHDDPVRRLRFEWQLLGKLDHPNIVSVTDAGFTNEGIPYFVMERLEGETLYARMGREPRWSVPSCLQLALDLLDGLVEAHAKGIVHRDIKPSNIFLSRQSGAKLLDFGIAKLLSSNAAITAKGVTLGTPRYMAPEQACGQSADCRSDLYAIGVILFELVAGEHPFAQAQTPVEMLIAQAGWEPPQLIVSDASQNDEFVALVRKLLSKDPRDRPASAVAVRDCLREISSKFGLSQGGVSHRVGGDSSVNTDQARLPRHPTMMCKSREKHQQTTILGRRRSIISRGTPRQVSIVMLVVVAILSASSLATPSPIHRVLSSILFSGRNSSSKQAARAHAVLGIAAEERSASGPAAPQPTVSEKVETELGVHFSSTAAATGKPHQEICAPSSCSEPIKANPTAGAERTRHRSGQTLRPTEAPKFVAETGRDQSSPNVEYESLTRR